MRGKILLVAALAIASPARAETLNNSAIVALSAAGLGDEAIIAKIKASTPSFDLSTDQIIALKRQGVSGAVIAAMLAAANPIVAPAALSMTSADPMVPHPPGVYLLGSDDTVPTMHKIDATMSNQAKTGGILGYALTGGIASVSMKASISNETARSRSHSRLPTFYFFFDEANPDGNRQAATWNSGSNASVSSPNEFTLIHLTAKKGRREARVGSLNIGGAKTGVMDKDQIAFGYEMVRPGVYKATPRSALAPGEYGFIYALSGGGTAGAMSARIFDFTVI